MPLADLSWWPFWKYQPHHNILWVWLKVGAPGFTVFCILMFGSLALASSRALTLKDPTLITFAYLGIASVVTSLVFCYVDLGLTNGRVTAFLGVVLGVLAVVAADRAGRPAGLGRQGEEAGQPAPVETVAARRPRRPAWSARAERDRPPRWTTIRQTIGVTRSGRPQRASPAGTGWPAARDRSADPLRRALWQGRIRCQQLEPMMGTDDERP